MEATIPAADPADSENVAWLLTTARMLWTKGERKDAVRWVERAANAARDEGRAQRATELIERTRALAVAAPDVPVRTAARKLLEQTLNSSPPAEGAAPKAPPVVVRAPEAAAPRSPVAAAAVDARDDGAVEHEIEIASSDLKVEEPGASTRRFDYPEALAKMATPSAAGPVAPALPDGVLPAIRVWIVAGEVIPAVGQRPAGAADAMLVSSAPGVDLVRALSKPR